MKWIGKSTAQHCNIDIGLARWLACLFACTIQGRETRVVKPIECGKSFHLITQPRPYIDRQQTEKTEHFLHCFGENVYGICHNKSVPVHHLFAIWITKHNEFISMIHTTNMLFFSAILHTCTTLMEWFMGFDCKISFWWWSNQIMSSILHILCIVAGDGKHYRHFRIKCGIMNYLEQCYSLRYDFILVAIKNEGKPSYSAYKNIHCIKNETDTIEWSELQFFNKSESQCFKMTCVAFGIVFC